ncbi:MAG: response regulator, partial [Clostridia bacterium]|nr:response regulator [Clostridia bacterium]
AKDRLRHLVGDLRNTLASIGMEDLLVRRSGRLAILRDRVDCDLYRMEDGDMEAVNAFTGEYMTQYSWAELTNGQLTFQRN